MRKSADGRSNRAPVIITPRTALVIIDMQKAIDDPSWAKHGPHNHPNAEAGALQLIERGALPGGTIARRQVGVQAGSHIRIANCLRAGMTWQ
jgi:hypothetical protein